LHFAHRLPAGPRECFRSLRPALGRAPFPGTGNRIAHRGGLGRSTRTCARLALWRSRRIRLRLCGIEPRRLSRALCALLPDREGGHLSCEIESGALVVVVDDEPMVLDMVAEGLRDLEVETAVFTDPHAALESIKSRRPAIVLADLHMPKMNGIELLEAVVSFDAGIEVFLLTGDYSTTAAVEAIKKGAADYLTKPISMSLLRE